MSNRILRFASLSLVCACMLLIATHTPIFAKSDEAKTLIALDTDWSKAAEARNAEKVASFYADDAMVYPPNMPMVKGRADAQKIWAQALADPNSKMSWKTTSAGVNGNMGFTAGTYEESMSGKTTGTGKYLCVWQKGADGKWKATHDMWNSDK